MCNKTGSGRILTCMAYGSVLITQNIDPDLTLFLELQEKRDKQSPNICAVRAVLPHDWKKIRLIYKHYRIRTSHKEKTCKDHKIFSQAEKICLKIENLK